MCCCGTREVTGRTFHDPFFLIVESSNSNVAYRRIHAAYINKSFNARHGNTSECYHATDASDEHESLITSFYIRDESRRRGV